MKKFKDIDYHYIYTVDFDKKYIKEYQVKDYDVDPEDSYTYFPYKECGFEDPFALINSAEWIIDDFKGNRIKEVNGEIK